MKNWKTALLSFVSVSGLIAGILAGNSCGRPDDAGNDSSTHHGGDYIPVNGLVGFGSQCPYGTIGEMRPFRTQLWNCPIGPSTVEFTRDMTPLYLQADCKSRILNVRTPDKAIDTSWYFLPSGEFDIIVDGVSAQLKADGSGSTDCNAPLAMNIFGRVTCGDGVDKDKATIAFQSVMWAGKKLNGQGNSPVVLPSPSPSGIPPAPPRERTVIANPCKLPSSCYFYTEVKDLKQCQ